MFGIGMPEMLMILAVALIVFGPKRLPDLAKSLGRALGEFRRATSDLKQSIETETGLDEVRSSLDEVKKDVEQQMDLAGAVPAASATPEAEQGHSEEPLDNVKAAFDKMNTDAAPSPPSSAEIDTESETAPDTEADTPPQDKDTP